MRSQIVDYEDKAGYNQAARITEVLAMLRSTYISCKMSDDFQGSLESCRSIIDVISGKVKADKIKELNNKVYVIETKIPKAIEKYQNGGMIFIKNPMERKATKILIETLYRLLERTQDEYGYGMVSEDDSGL